MTHFLESKTTIYINSRNRLSGTDTDFLYEMPIQPQDGYNWMALTSASIPKSFYNIVSGRNTFIIVELGVERIITVSEGNYNTKAFIKELKLKLNTNQPVGWLYDVTFPGGTDVQTGKLTYSVTGNSGNQPSIVTTTFVYEALGFLRNTTNTFVNDTITSTAVCNFNKESTLLVRCDMILGKHNHLKSIMSSGNDSFTYIIYNEQNIEAMAKNLVKGKSNLYRFQLTDEDDNIIDLNGLNWVFTLILFRYKSPLPNIPIEQKK